MEFKDRQGQNLNRKKIKIISQTPTEIVADIERFDNVTEEGTKINASVFNAFQSEINESSRKVTSAVTTANEALTTANQANLKSDNAVQSANSSLENSNQAVTTANTANTNSIEAVTTANTAFTNSEQAVSDSSIALTNSNNAIVTANAAKENSEQAVSTANSAFKKSTESVNTANTANLNANDAKTIADEAKTIAESVVSTANNAETIANQALNHAANIKGTTITVGGVEQNTFDADTKVDVTTFTSQISSINLNKADKLTTDTEIVALKNRAEVLEDKLTKATYDSTTDTFSLDSKIETTQDLIISGNIYLS